MISTRIKTDNAQLAKQIEAAEEVSIDRALSTTGNVTYTFMDRSVLIISNGESHTYNS